MPISEKKYPVTNRMHGTEAGLRGDSSDVRVGPYLAHKWRTGMRVAVYFVKPADAFCQAEGLSE